MIDYSDNLDSELSPVAIKYWAANVWDRDSDDFIKLSELINLEFNVQPFKKTKVCTKVGWLKEGTKFIDHSGKEGVVINITDGGTTVKYRKTGVKSHISSSSPVKPL